MLSSVSNSSIDECTYRGPNDNSLSLDVNTRIQIIDSMDLLPEAEKDQCGAFIVS